MALFSQKKLFHLILNLRNSYSIKSAVMSNVASIYCYSTKSGHSVDGSSSVMRVHEYFASLKVNRNHARNKSAKKLEPNFQYKNDDKLVSCSLTLPSCIPLSSRYVESPFVVSKSLSKRIACLCAIEILHTHGKLDDSLKILPDDSCDDIMLMESQPTIAVESGIVDLQESEERVLIKIVPDSLQFVESTGLFLYSLTETSDFSTSVSCYDCASYCKAASTIGIALQRRLSEDILSQPIMLSIRKDVSLTVQLNFVKELHCTEEEVRQMERFHCAVTGVTSASERILSSLHASWSDSNNGAWYLTFALPKSRDMSIINDHAIFLTHLKESADEACTVMDALHLLRTGKMVLHDVKDLISREYRESPMLNGFADFNDFEGRMVVDQFLRMYVIPCCDPNISQAKLSDVLKKRIQISTLHSSTSLESQVQHVSIIATTQVPMECESEEGECTTETETSSESNSSVDNWTFYDQFIKNHSHLTPLLTKLNSSPQHRLLPVYELSKRVVVQSLLSPNMRMRGKNTLYVVPELCSVLGNSLWYYYSLVFPSVMHRVQSLLLADEARHFIGCEHVDLGIMLQAITPKMCLESIDSERLEMLGDSFLKYAVGVDLYKQYPEANEGELTTLRGHIVSNRNLCEVAQRSGLDKYVRALPLYCDGSSVMHYIPPGRCVNGERLAPPQYALVTVKYKTLSDLVESVIGACLLSGGVSEATRVMKRLGLLSEIPVSTAVSCALSPDMKVRRSMNEINKTCSADEFAQSILDSSPYAHVTDETMNVIESAFHYQFKYKQYLAQALTHSSVTGRQSNERLEFLGDAVLDYLVVDMLFREQPQLDQGGLTTTKSKVTCNRNLAQFSLKHNLLKYLSHDSRDLYIANEQLTQCGHSTHPINGTGTQETAVATKTLADICETIIGAIYLDSGEDLSVLPKVVKDFVSMS